MDDRQRYEAGSGRRRAVLGNAHVDRAAGAATPFTEEFQDLITRYCWGEIWTRPGLDERTRRVLAIGTMVALGRWAELRLHVGAALDHGGMTPEDVKEILLQQAIYCGVPTANHAFSEVAALLDAREPHRRP
ncbi:MAG: carboxymuconolactone decarboxylase family protein [Vicinamibacterales bacterium]